MRIRTALSEDTTSAALDTKAHALEHCAIDRESFDVLKGAVGCRVLGMRSAKWLALYTVAARIDVAGPAARVGTVGLARVEDPTGEPPAPKLRAALETDFLGGDSSARVRLTEELLGRAGTGRAVLAPHGGRIEPGTDDQAAAIYRLLAEAQAGSSADRAGVQPAGAHRCWHITASEISEHSSPKLGALFARGGVSWTVRARGGVHGQTIPTRSSSEEGFLRTPAHRAQEAAQGPAPRRPASRDGAPAGGRREAVGTARGIERANIVNRVTVRGNGIQLEQPAAVRAYAEEPPRSFGRPPRSPPS